MKKTKHQNFYDIRSGRLYHGDCLEVMKAIPDGSIDMILCDLPYGTTACKWDVVIPVIPLWEQYERIIKNNGSIVLTANQPFTSILIQSNIKLFKYEMIWVKNRATGVQQSKNRPMGKHENIIVFSKAPMGHESLLKDKRMVYNSNAKISGTGVVPKRGIMKNQNGARPNQIGRKYVVYTNFPTTILNFPKDENSTHPTQKPVKLFECLIKQYTNENEVVLDNCSGSGTTAIACERTKRKWICIEKEEEYIELTLNRIKSNNKIRRSPKVERKKGRLF